MKKNAFFLLTLLVLSFSKLIHAEEAPAKKVDKEEVKEDSSVTTNTIKINGVDLSYKATAGNYAIRNKEGAAKATIFYIAYTKEGVEDKKERPITFCFNGGPGSSSVWLHLGILGPKRVFLSDKGFGMQPFHLVDNEFSILDVTDLVFIDPVSTGFSRATAGEDAKQFHGVEEDVNSVAEFIRLYTTRNERWESPKFVAGESYGTTRAAALAGNLHDKHHMILDGILLISTVLNFQTMSLSQPGNDLPYILYLPSFTATAWYHKKLPPKLLENFDKTMELAQNFALNEYSHALMLGDRLEKEHKQKIVQQVADLTGLSPAYVEGSNLRVNMYRYVKELLRDRNRTTGRFDSRFEGIDSDSCGETFEYDPSFEAIVGAFTATFNEYVRAELGWKCDHEYAILANVSPWNYGSAASNQYLNVAETLRDVMTRNPDLGVFVGSGYYDLATPYFATDYTFTHLGLDPSLRSHVTMKIYKGGHMMYINKETLEEMKGDLHEFYLNNTNRNNR